MSRDNHVDVLVTGDPENLGIGFGTALISVPVVEKELLPVEAAIFDFDRKLWLRIIPCLPTR
jgi:hypothetical protein